MSEASNAFDRAAEQEERESKRRFLEAQIDPGEQYFGMNLTGLALSSVTLLGHWLAVRRVTKPMAAHIGFLGLTLAGTIHAWTVKPVLRKEHLEK